MASRSLLMHIPNTNERWGYTFKESWTFYYCRSLNTRNSPLNFELQVQNENLLHRLVFVLQQVLKCLSDHTQSETISIYVEDACVAKSRCDSPVYCATFTVPFSAGRYTYSFRFFWRSVDKAGKVPLTGQGGLIDTWALEIYEAIRRRLLYYLYYLYYYYYHSWSWALL
jgi:hypothetical protein